MKGNGERLFTIGIVLVLILGIIFHHPGLSDAQTFKAAGVQAPNPAAGTNHTGTALTLSSGKATGNAAGGDIILKTSDAGSSGPEYQSLTTKAILKTSGKFGIGTSSPGALLTVGSDKYQVDPNGNQVKIRNVAYSWPYSQGSANTLLKNDGSGNLTWSTVPAASIAAGSAQYQYLVTGANPYASGWSTGYLNVASGKTLTASNSLTLAGTDAKGLTLTGSLTVPSDMTLAGMATQAANSVAITGGSIAVTTFSVTNRMNVAGAKTLTDAATSLFEITLAAGAMTGGQINATIEASDGTDHQVFTQIVTFAAVNKAGAYTKTVTVDADNDAKAASGGTLTTSWAFAEGTNKLTMQVTPTGSLTETTYRITYIVMNNSPQTITIL